MKRIAYFAALMAVALLPAAAFAQGDVAGSSDHPEVGRYEGSVITHYESKGYEELWLPEKPVMRAEKDDPSAWQRELKGKLTQLRYTGPGGRSVLEVIRNYEASLQQKGFEIEFFCRQKDCAPDGSLATFWDAGRAGMPMPTSWGSSTYLLATRDEVTVGIFGIDIARGDTPFVVVTVVEGQPIETDKIVLVEADAMETALAKDGRIAIYGIYFDFDRAELKPESGPQIDELGRLLAGNPNLRVLIVGHTDGQGAFDYNLSLSQKRAQAVVDALVSGHGVAADRMIPAGAGMVAPVATNRTEEGRAKNRRVEIVELYEGG